MVSQVPSVASSIHGLMAITTHSAVPTPLPPFNFRKIGNTWPRKAAMAQPATKTEPIPKRLATYAAMNTASQPLAASLSRVSAAPVLLPVSNPLVAHGFLDPKLRGSARPSMRLTTTAKETDPSKYDAIIMPLVNIGKATGGERGGQF